MQLRLQNTLNLIQLLYILDIDNYKKDYKTFNLNFQNANKFDISENLYNMFKSHFRIELLFNNDEIFETFNFLDKNFGKNDNDLLIMTPTFNDCLPFDNIEFLYFLSISEN